MLTAATSENMDGIGSHFTTERVKTGHSRPTAARASTLLDHPCLYVPDLQLIGDVAPSPAPETSGSRPLLLSLQAEEVDEVVDRWSFLERVLPANGDLDLQPVQLPARDDRSKDDAGSHPVSSIGNSDVVELQSPPLLEITTQLPERDLEVALLEESLIAESQAPCVSASEVLDGKVAGRRVADQLLPLGVFSPLVRRPLRQ